MRDIRDLVERLRKNDAKAAVSTSQQPPFSIQGEAADEIEALREALRASQAEAGQKSGKVFIVIGWWDYEGYNEPEGVYSTREKAEAIKAMTKRYDNVDIMEYEINADSAR